MSLDYTTRTRLPMLSDTSRVSEIKQCSRELAARLEWALSLAGVSETVVDMDPVNARLTSLESNLASVTSRTSTVESKARALETKVADLTTRLARLEAMTVSKAAPTLGSGWTQNAASAIYDKRTGLVHVVIDATNSAAIPNGSILATLPAGFRPSKSLSVTGSQSEGGAATGLPVVIGTDGIVRVWPGTTSNKRAAVSAFWSVA